MEYLLKLKRARLILTLRKKRQYKRIIKKLDDDINMCVVAMKWDLAAKKHHRLLKVRRIWKGIKGINDNSK